MCKLSGDGRDNLEGLSPNFNIPRRIFLYIVPTSCPIDLRVSVIPSTSTDSWLHGDTQIGFKVFLNITPTVTNWTTDGKQFSLIFEENPLADFVELPDDGRAQNELWYSNLLCGVLRGSLEMVSSSWFPWGFVVVCYEREGGR